MQNTKQKMSVEQLQVAYDRLWESYMNQENRVFHRDQVIEQMQTLDQRREPYILLSAEELSLLPMTLSVRLGAGFQVETSEDRKILAYGWLIHKRYALQGEILNMLYNAKECGLLGFMMPGQSNRYGCITDFFIGQRDLEWKGSRIPIACEININLSCDDMINTGFIYPFFAKYAGTSFRRALQPDAFIKLTMAANTLPKGIPDWRQYIDFDELFFLDSENSKPRLSFFDKIKQKVF